MKHFDIGKFFSNELNFVDVTVINKEIHQQISLNFCDTFDKTGFDSGARKRHW